MSDKISLYAVSVKSRKAEPTFIHAGQNAVAEKIYLLPNGWVEVAGEQDSEYYPPNQVEFARGWYNRHEGSVI